MKIQTLHITNFKSIRDLSMKDIDMALILVGKNNTGKTAVLDAIRLAWHQYALKETDFNERDQRIEIEVTLQMTDQDLHSMHQYGIFNHYKRFDSWYRDVLRRLPSLRGEQLYFKVVANKDGLIRYSDGIKKHNPYIREILPRLYFLDTTRNLSQLQEDILMFQEDEQLTTLRSGRCIFDEKKPCDRCFNCIGLIHQKKAYELDMRETSKLLEYKMYHLNLNRFSEKVDRYFHKNGAGQEEIHYSMDYNINDIFRVQGEVWYRERNTVIPVERLSKGMRSIYVLSLLEAYIDEEKHFPSIIMLEDPEIYLHPQLQKTAGEILYRLSSKNQVIFSTHSPILLFNFRSGQIRQIVLDKDYYTIVREKTNIGNILSDLGYTANDLLNVSFVFFVEGKQDKSRLPLLLEKYYSEIMDAEGNLARVAIISTNSCTNIKTYANLKYMNQLYFREQFLMIRDGDGKDPAALKESLCHYYKDRNMQDMNTLPQVRPENVLILKYYSFENYFLKPEIMAAVGVIPEVDYFYNTLYEKWTQYLYRLDSGRNFVEKTGAAIGSPEDIKTYMEPFLIYMRGHNLFDIFYGRFKEHEREILKAYIDAAPRDTFKDILDAIDAFIYFENRKK